MSKYEENYDSVNSICPYCSTSFQVEHEDYDEEGKEIECFDCGRKYYLITEHSINFTSKPDCELNGEKHQMENVEGYNFKECKICGKFI